MALAKAKKFVLQSTEYFFDWVNSQFILKILLNL